MTREESTKEMEDRLSKLRTLVSVLSANMRWALCYQDPPLTVRDREKELDPVIVSDSFKYKADRMIEHAEAFIEYVKRHTTK